MTGRQYEIHIKGHLSQDWENWLDCMEMCFLENGEMILSGMLADQAALMGILNKLSYLNLCILSVNETKRNEPGQKACKESERESKRCIKI